MMTELEAKFLRIDPEGVRASLEDVGARLVYPERLMRRKTFDFPDRRLLAKGGWVRVRDEGDKITMSYKEIRDRSLEGMKESMVTVSDFEAASTFLVSVGLEQTSFQENRRETWTFDGCEIVIDTWPWAPPFIEIEGESEGRIRAVAERLGFEWLSKRHGGIEVVYEDAYRVEGHEVTAIPELVFSTMPLALRSKERLLERH